MRRVISLLLLLSLPISAVAEGQDNYVLNLIIPTATPTPTPAPSSGGGSGGASGYAYRIPVSSNPPMVLLEVKDLTASSVLLELAIKNEGEMPWEYIYNWGLVRLDKKGNEIEEIKKWTASKYLKEGEKAGIPIEFKDLSAGKYLLNVNVNYGEYTSKAQVTFEIEAQQRLTTRVKNTAREGKYFIIGTASLATLLYFVTRNPIKRTRRPPMH